MLCLNRTVNELLEKGIVRHLAVRVGKNEEILHDVFVGGVTEKTLFDMASVTKIMATTMLAFIAMEKNLLSLEDPVNKFYATDKPLTVKNLLTHTMGIGHKSLQKEGNTRENIAEQILAIPSDVPIGTEVLYSCPGYILLGKILEKIFGDPLDVCFDRLVAKPLGLSDTSFLPTDRQNAVNANSEEELRGVVNDYNCRFLGGVAGNAGLFSNLRDVTKYVGLLRHKGAPLFGERIFETAVQNYTPEMSQSRGLGFLYVDERYAQTGGLFQPGAIGHCGHTGQSVFVDPKTGFYVIVLSDATRCAIQKHGKVYYNEVMDMRARLHAAIKRDLQAR